MATGSSEVASSNTELGEDDLGALYEAIYPARNSYKSIGLLIGVNIGEIENIESNKTDSGDRLLAILSVRVKKSKPLTWNEIDSALRSEYVDESRLSDKIRKYGHFFIPDPSTESDSEQEHPTGDHRARLIKESSEYEIVRSKKHVQEVESEDGEDSVKEKKELSKRENLEKHDKERAKGINKFMKDESESEEVVREKSKRKKKATHDREVSVKGYGDRDHYSDTEVCEKVCEKVRKGSKKHSKIREVSTESESEASSDEEEIEDSSFEDDTSHKRRKVTQHTQVIIKERHPQKEYRKDRKTKPRDIQSSDEELSSKKFKISKKVETESEEESSFASSSDEEESSTKKSKHTETKSAAHTKDKTHYEKCKTSGVSLKLHSATAEATHSPEEYKDKGRKKTVRVDEKVGKSTDSSRETYHKTRSKPQAEAEDDEREVVTEKATAPPLERVLPSSEMAETDSGDGENENESEQKSSDEEEETENDDSSSVEEKEKSKQTASTLTTTTEMRKTKSQDDETSKQKKSSKALSKDDSHGDKEEADPGGSRDQEDQPKRRRHRESSKTPIVRGGSSPSSSQEERKPGSRRQRSTHKHGGKYNENKKRRETSSSSTDTDSSSSESDMLKNLTKSEKKKLKKVFKYSFGQLCSASFNPVETAVQLQKKGLISPGMMMDIIRSPESQQDKIIRLVCGLDNRIRSRPERLFGCIEVLLENDGLQEVGREMLRETGKPLTHQAQGIFVMCIS